MKHRVLRRVGLSLAALLLPASVWAADVYKIGAVFPMTGSLAWLGEYYRKAAELQVDMLNEQGGVNGRKLELVVYDDLSTPEGAARAAQRLISRDRVVAVIGTGSVPMSGAVATVVKEHRIPAVLSSGYVVDASKDAFVFNTAHRTDFAVERPFRYFAGKGMKRVSLLMPLGPLGDVGIGAAQKAAEKHGIKLVANERFNPQSPDLTAQLAQLRAAKPDAVFSFVTGEAAAMVARNMAQIKFDVPLLVSHGNATPGFLKMVSGLNTQIIVPSGPLSVAHSIPKSSPIYDVAMRFVAAHEKRYGEPPNYFSGLTADAVRLIVEAIRRANSAEGDAMRAALEQIRDFPGYGGVYRLSPTDHHGTAADEMVLLRPTPSGWVQIQ